MVGNNTPVFFVRDALKFGDFIHSQKRVPGTNLRSPTVMWDFWSLSPESLHQVTTLFSDRGTPDGYRHMHGFSSHTYSLINADRKRFWVKWHFLTMQGIKNLSGGSPRDESAARRTRYRPSGNVMREHFSRITFACSSAALGAMQASPIPRLFFHLGGAVAQVSVAYGDVWIDGFGFQLVVGFDGFGKPVGIACPR